MAEDVFVLQKYHILEKLADGGMAEIFLATRKETQFQNRFYVIKRVLPTLAEKTQYLIYLKDEAKALSLLQHQNIVGYHDFFYENEEFYLVMEYINGKTLRDFFTDLQKANYPLSIEYLLYIVTEVAAGLDYAHNCFDHLLDKSLNLVHRDLNPQNIMVSFEGQIKIIDFGISKFDIRDDVTKTGMLKGKFGYMSPEQVEGLAIDARTDIFALGILCWELLTNKRLFDGEDDFEKYEKIKNYHNISMSEHNSMVSKELDEIVMKALAPNASERYQNASELRHDLTRYLVQNFPDFRPEKFQKMMSHLYASDFKKSVDRMKVHFKKAALEVEQLTITSQNEATRDKYGGARGRSGQTLISVSGSFEDKISLSKLKLQMPHQEPANKPLTTETAPQKSRRAPRVTLQEPERYTVQAGNIQSNRLHVFMNSRAFHAISYMTIFGGVACLAFFSYELGYFHTAYHRFVELLKHAPSAFQSLISLVS